MKNNGTIKNSRTSNLLGTLCNFILTLVPAIAFYYTYINYYWRASFYDKGNLLSMALYLVMLISLMQTYRGYKIRQSRTRELIFAFIIAGFLSYAVMYIVMCLIAHRILPLRYGIITYIVQCILEAALYVASRMLIDRIEPKLETVFIYNPDIKYQEVEKKLNSSRSRFQINQMISSKAPWKDILNLIEKADAVAIGGENQKLRNHIANYCFGTEKTLIVVPEMTDIIEICTEPTVVEDGLFFVSRKRNEFYQLLKRFADIILSGAGLIILSPIIVLIALLIKLYDGGPVFYRQVRLTKAGKEFYVIKFRSMIVNAEKNTGAVMAGKKDSRITPIGHFIRACRLDEIPQLWNIFVGDMTFVGPRPERPEFYEQYCEAYPEFAYRLRVKAGLTGYAQLYGKYNTTFEEKAKLDVYYIQHESLLLDIQLIFYTIKILFSKESTEGVDSSEKKK